MSYRRGWILALCAAVTATPALPGDAATGGLGLRLGTGGIAVDYTLPLSPSVDLRGAANFGSYSRTETYDDIEYDGTIEFSGVSLIADWRPFHGGFRLSAGAYSSAPEVGIRGGDPDNLRTYSIGDRDYNGRISLDGNVDLGGFAPYVGVGWGGSSAQRGFGMSLDAGVLFASKPDIRLDVRGPACDATLEPGCDPNDPDNFNEFETSEDPDFQAEKEKEIQRIEADVEDLDIYPVISIGFHYRF